MQLKTCIWALVLVLICTIVVEADIKLPAIFSDNMVLQQKKQITIWGWANPRENVKVNSDWDSSVKATDANQAGKWMITIETPAAGGPYNLFIKGNNTVTIKNILIGEVWLCSGQSNMEFSVKSATNAEQEIKEANYPKIRLFQIGENTSTEPLDDCNGTWQICSPNSIPRFTAIGYFFGREIHKELNCPVGLIESAWGGTGAESWTPKEILQNDEEFLPILNRDEEVVKNKDKYKQKYSEAFVKWEHQVEQDKAEGKTPPRQPSIPSELRPEVRASRLYNAMIHPIIPFTIKGVVWYQGENNFSRAYQYRKLFPAMISSWREKWNQGDFPFYYVQIAPYHYGNPNDTRVPELQEAQMMTLKCPNTGMVVITDIGDVNNVHPCNKQDVGKRLALWAMAKDYGCKNIVYSGPLYKAMKTEGNKIRLYFDYADSGLMSKDGELKEFIIAGSDQKFYPATAVIEGNTVIVSSEQVTEPAAVRYSWRHSARPNLFNKEGLPASPFRTDDWPGKTIGLR
jgi:sialate O-acetylesterase